MSYCPQCGEELNDEEAFCSSCGADLSESQGGSSHESDNEQTEEAADKGERTITLGKIVAYPAGILLLLIGLGSLVDSVIAGVLFLVAGLLALPIVRGVIANRQGIRLSRWATVGIVLVAGVAGGAILGPDTGDPGEDVADIEVDHANHEVDNAANELHITYNARAQNSVNPASDSLFRFESQDGEKYVVTRVDVENRGDQQVELYNIYGMNIDGITHSHEYVGEGIGDVTLDPGASYDGYLVFEVPEDATEGTLTVEDEDIYFDGGISVTFEQDDSLEVELDE